jgi:kumamolisin
MPTKVTLPGSQKHLLPNSRPAGPVDPSEITSVTVRLRSAEDPKELEAIAYKLADQPLAERTYLSPGGLGRRFGASAADLDAIESFAQKHNLVVSHRSAAKRSIVLTGKIGDLLSAFPADVQMYHHAMGTYRGRRGEISIPSELNGIITGIFGFDTRPKHRSPFRAKASSLAGPGGQNGVAATDFASRYNFPETQGNKTLDGSGQTIAIIELGGGYRASDLEIFFQEIGAPKPNVVAVSVDNAGNAPSSPDSADGEVMLDIEVAGAVVPAANLVVYFAPNVGDKGFLDAISAAVHDTERKPSVISISWGGPEQSTDLQGVQAYHELFAAAAALGITICIASGDHGTADLDADHWDGKIHVDHPACDDLVLACGGTQVENGKDVVWNDGTPFDTSVQGGGGWAGGGGISEVFAVPSYQSGAKLPVSIDTNKPGRGVPDIAMSAVNYFTRVDTYEGASGGTSAVAPLMAALIAKLNQAKSKNVGFLNPFLYAQSSHGATKDVSRGTNAIKDTVKGYKARKGWDACTGLGTPDGKQILNLL